MPMIMAMRRYRQQDTMFGLPYLSTVIWLPIVAGVAVLFTRFRPQCPCRPLAGARRCPRGPGGCAALYAGFDPSAAGMQFVELLPWIESYNVNYHLGIDGISLLMILLNCFTTVLVVLAGWQVVANACPSTWRLPDPVGDHERRVLRAGCRALLCVLRGDADSDVHRHRRVGRPEPGLCSTQVLPLHVGRLRC